VERRLKRWAQTCLPECTKSDLKAGIIYHTHHFFQKVVELIYKLCHIHFQSCYINIPIKKRHNNAPCMEESGIARLGAAIADDMNEDLSAFAHSVFSEPVGGRQKLVRSSFANGARRLEGVADLSAGVWLHALPIASSCQLRDRSVVCALFCQLGRALLACRISPEGFAAKFSTAER
jgi:hypothetical protein